jgi:hypothetical protein
MTRFNMTAYRATLSLAAVLAAGPLSHAASSLTNSLKSFTGNSSEVATQTALAAAGFDFFSLEGLSPDFTSDPAVTFDAAGAHFGLDFALAGGGGDGGRNYMRTIESDYATVSFVAEITMDLDMGTGANQLQNAFFGMGAGETAYFGVPDWSTQFSSTFTTPERGFLKTWRSSNDVNVWNDNDPVAILTGAATHRVRMTYNGTAHTIIYAIDVNYAGGAFAADYTAPSIDLNTVNCPEGCGGGTDASLYDPDLGWPLEPSKIYFGGDDGVNFKDFSVTVGTSANANFNGDTNIDGADFLIWQRGVGLNAGATLGQGDADGNGAVNGGDLTIWKNQFGTTPGVGAASAAPEPAAGVIAAMATAGCWLRRRAARRLP